MQKVKERNIMKSLPLWTACLGCIISFLLGRSTSSFSPSMLSSISHNSESACHNKEMKETIAELQRRNGILYDHLNATAPILKQKKEPCPICNCPDPKSEQQIPVKIEPAPNQQQQTGVVFNEEWLSNPKTVLSTINEMCLLIMNVEHSKYTRQIGIPTIMFCSTHVLTYKRNYDYKWDALDNTRNTSIDLSNGMGYYTGVEIPPYQMDMLQYLAIHSVMFSIPQRPIKEELEMKGSEFQDDTFNYKRRQNEVGYGPRVLFWGCGSDTPLHARVVEFIGGNITFIDNNAGYLKMCRESYNPEPDIRLIEPNGTKNEHTDLIWKLWKNGAIALDTNDVSDALTSTQWMTNLDGIENEPPWDVIVIDGPGEDFGRSQPLYMAKRLAQSYSTNHYTHVFLHDASRKDNCIVANAIMGHDPAEYMGNTLPRKGLKHWRVPGRNRRLPPTNSNRV